MYPFINQDLARMVASSDWFDVLLVLACSALMTMFVLVVPVLALRGFLSWLP